MVSALLMLRRLAQALRCAVREEEFLAVFGAGAVLVGIGTVVYATGEEWNIVDALYFAVATLTTTSVSDPDLVLEDRWLKIFTVLYQLVGIGARGDPAQARRRVRRRQAAANDQARRTYPATKARTMTAEATMTSTR